MAKPPGRSANYSNQAGSIRSDELNGYLINDLRAGSNPQSNNPGGTITYPFPYFGAGGTTYWQIVSVSDDDEQGLACFTQWRIPQETTRLVVHCRYVNKDGSWGRRFLHKQTHDITDTDRAAQFLEWEWTKLRPKKRIIITRVIAHLGPKRGSTTVKNPKENLVVCGTPQTRADGTTNPEYDATHVATPPGPPTVMGTDPTNFVTGGFPPSSHELAQIWTGNYLPANVRVTAVGSARKEQDGVYWPVTVTFNANSCREIGFGLARVGARGADGKIDLTVYNGVTAADTTEALRIKHTHHHHIPRRLLTDQEMLDGTAIMHVGPFNAHQAKRTWHILRVHSRNAVDELATRQHRETYPSDDTTLSSSPTDYAPINTKNGAGTVIPTPGDPTINGGLGSAFLGVLMPDGPITDAPSDPNLNHTDGQPLILRNEADEATETAGDYVIELKAWVAQANTTAGAGTTNKKASDTNADEIVFVIARKERSGDPAVTGDKTQWKRFKVELDPDDEYATIQFHRKHHRRLVWIKNRAKNSIDRKDSTGAAYTFRVGNRRGQDENPETMITNKAGTNTAAGSSGRLGISCADDWTSDGETGTRHKRVNVGWNNNVTTPATPRKLVVWVSKTTTEPSAGLQPGALGFVYPESTQRDDVTGEWAIEKSIHLKGEEDLHAGGNTAPGAFAIGAYGGCAFRKTVGIKVKQGEIRYFLFALLVAGSALPIYSEKVDNIPGNDSTGAPSDTAVPGAPGNPTARFRHGHLRLFATRPTSQNSTIFQREWEISTTSGFTAGSTWVVRSDSSPFSTTAPTVAANTAVLATGQHVSIPLRRKDFRDQSWTGNIYVRCRDYNMFDPTTGGTYSNGGVGIAVLSVANFDGDAGTVPDSAAAAPSAAVSATLGSGGLSVVIQKIDDRVLERCDFAFNTDSSGTGHWVHPYTGADLGFGLGVSDLPSGAVTSPAFEGAHKHFHSRLRRRDFANNLGIARTPLIGDTLLYAFARFVDRDPDGASRYGAWNATGFDVIFQPGGADKDAAQPPKHHAAAFRNFIVGGGMAHSRFELDGTGATTDLGVNFRTRPGTAYTFISTATTDGITWDQSNHLVTMVPTTTRAAGTTTTADTSRGICGKIKKSAIIPGDMYSFTFLMKKASGTCVNHIVEIYDETNGVVATKTVSGTRADGASESGVFSTFYAALSVTGAIDRNAAQYLRVRPSADDSATYSYDDFMLTRSDRAVPFDSHPDEDGHKTAATLSTDTGSNVGKKDLSGLWNDGVTGGGLDYA